MSGRRSLAGIGVVLWLVGGGCDGRDTMGDAASIRVEPPDSARQNVAPRTTGGEPAPGPTAVAPDASAGEDPAGQPVGGPAAPGGGHDASAAARATDAGQAVAPADDPDASGLPGDPSDARVPRDDEGAAAPGWQAAALIADGLLPFALDAAIDEHGNAVVAWEQTDDYLINVHASYREADSDGWGVPTAVERADNRLKTVAPQVGIDASGNAFVLWHREPEDLVSSEVWGSRYRADSEAWGQAERVSSGVGMLPELVVHPAGDASALWIGLQGLSIALMIGRYDAATGRWGPEERFDRSGGIAATVIPVVDTAPGGGAIVAWTQGDLLAGTVTGQARRASPDTGAWDAPEQFARDATMTGNTTLIVTDVALNDAGSAFAVYQDSEQEDVITVWASRYDESLDAWSEARRLGQQEMELAKLPQVAVDPAGNAVAVWSAYTGAHQNVWTNRYRADQGGWGSAEPLACDPGADCAEPQIGIDEAGNAIVAWIRQDATGQTLWVNHHEASADRWSPATPLDLGELSEGYYPKLVVAPSGEALVVWAGWDRGVYTNRYRRSTDGR